MCTIHWRHYCSSFTVRGGCLERLQRISPIVPIIAFQPCLIAQCMGNGFDCRLARTLRSRLNFCVMAHWRHEDIARHSAWPSVRVNVIQSMACAHEHGDQGRPHAPVPARPTCTTVGLSSLTLFSAVPDDGSLPSSLFLCALPQPHTLPFRRLHAPRPSRVGHVCPCGSVCREVRPNGPLKAPGEKRLPTFSVSVVR